MDIEHSVTVKLLFFAKSKELSGFKETTLSIPKKISYKQLLNIIAKKYNLETIKNNILLAKNEVVCEETVDIVVSDRDSIAVIPPLSGG
ncbi:molybdopterin synthase sulfur carrier subunit [Achroia grisella]|uniref:molybdopterin synthase sulfur carrier subunit n=1 Tax=Achroia grisella TaxID=688607 RepID=UPI0027D27D9B|nr:molybdopterin synthase sulfur carrier subunit [Achroia grisella]XP_059048002.1 molybdopterin synthase sulfur carrier subunit [Achroia grisella]